MNVSLAVGDPVITSDDDNDLDFGHIKSIDHTAGTANVVWESGRPDSTEDLNVLEYDDDYTD